MNTLPNTFQQVEYIESTGTQYIDTGINADSKLQTIIDTQYTDISNYDNTNFGAIKTEPSIIRYHIMRYSTFSVWLNGTENAFTNISADLNRHLFNLDVPNGKLMLDNNKINSSLETFDTELNFWLFARNSDSQSAIYYNKSKLYRCKMIYEGTTIRDFVPCYRKSDNTIGLYDVINDIFYTNNGTGTFIKGNNVTVADKLSYLRETKEQIKDRINFLTGEITDETPFRDYTVALDNLYNELPKTSSEGISITLEDTRKGKILITPKGNTEQETTTGKNVLNLKNGTYSSNGLTTNVNNGKITIQGTSTNFSAMDIPLNSDLILNGNYNLLIKAIGETTNVVSFQCLFRKSDNTNIWAYQLQNYDYLINEIKVNTTDTMHYIRLYIGQTATIDVELQIMMSEGDTLDDDFEPYTGGIASPNPDYPQDIKVVTGENNIIVRGKNLFNIETVQNYYLNHTNGTTSANNGWRTSDFINIKNIEQLTFSWDSSSYFYFQLNVAFYDINKNFISGLTYQGGNIYNKTFEVADNAYYCKIAYSIKVGNNEALRKNIQLEQGLIVTDYEPYKQPIEKELNLGNIELAKIGDYSDLIFKNEKSNPYYDNTLIENAWYKKQIIKSKVYDENDTFVIAWASTVDFYIFQTVNNSIIQDAKQNGNSLFCSNFNFIGTEQNSQPPVNEHIAINADNYSLLRITIATNRLNETSVEAFKTWLQTHNVLIYYILENPIYTQITDTTLINQLEEINKVIGKGGTIVIETESESNNAQLIVNVSALASFENS